MPRFSIHAGPPADAQRYKSLAWTIEPTTSTRLILKAWRGRAKKPFAHYWFNDQAAADKYLREQHETEDARERQQAKRQAEIAERLAEQLRLIQVGTLLCDSWGYEQTNIDFYEVVARRGSMVTVRPISQSSVPGSESSHGMADMVCPVPGHFTGEPFTKRITAYGLSMKHGTASVVDPWEKHYRSWYA